MKYYPHGYCQNSTGDLGTDKLFTGQRLDDTGLYYYNARYYDPLIGRFISPDTIVQNPANPQFFNRYSYCLNNPLKYTDPSGNDAYLALVQHYQKHGPGVPPPEWIFKAFHWQSSTIDTVTHCEFSVTASERLTMVELDPGMTVIPPILWPLLLLDIFTSANPPTNVLAHIEISGVLYTTSKANLTQAFISMSIRSIREEVIELDYITLQGRIPYDPSSLLGDVYEYPVILPQGLPAELKVESYDYSFGSIYSGNTWFNSDYELLQVDLSFNYPGGIYPDVWLEPPQPITIKAR